MLSFSVPRRAPNGLRVTSFEFTSDLLVEWNPLSQQYANGKILGYTIYYRDYNIVWSTYKSVNASSPFSTQATLKGLKPAHEYLVAVAAFTSKGVGPWSAHEYAITGMFWNDCFISYLLLAWHRQTIFKASANVSLQKCNEKHGLYHLRTVQKVWVVLFFGHVMLGYLQTTVHYYQQLSQNLNNVHCNHKVIRFSLVSTRLFNNFKWDLWPNRVHYYKLLWCAM